MMKKTKKRKGVLGPASPAGLKDLPARDRMVLTSIREELRRSMKELRLPGHPRPYLVSHLVKLNHVAEVWGKYGSIFHSREGNHCVVYTEVRVGSYRSDQNVDGGLEIDLTQFHSYDWIEGPIELTPDALRYSLWRLTQFKYEEALQQYYEKRKLQVEQRLDGRQASFAREPAFRYYQPTTHRDFPLSKWEGMVRRLTRKFKGAKELIDPHLEVRARRQARFFVNSEGTEFVTDETYYEGIVKAWVQGEEGRYLCLHRLFYGRNPRDLPDEGRIETAIKDLARDLKDLAKAEPLPPYEGPALLSGAAAGLLFHEALGHRLEGERMIARSEGQTFATRIGEQILPPMISVFDDPSLPRFDKTTLYGHYPVDDEGVPARRVCLVRNGILRNFLLSRSVAPGFSRSNGHGRNASFEDPMARMATLVVEGQDPKPWGELKALLLEEVRRRGKPYGLIIKGVEGGETSTRNYDFQAFKGVPTEVYKVDGRTGKETRVRDVEFIGTPLASLQRIVAVGQEIEVDNSYCVAESGAIPVSTIAPPVLVSEIELQRKSGRTYLAPILPPPWGKT